MLTPCRRRSLSVLSAGAPRDPRQAPWGARGERTRAPRAVVDMPGPGMANSAAEFFWRDGFSRIHDIQMEHRRRYGPLWKLRVGLQFVVSVADAEMIGQVLRAEGPTPQRANMESWKEYRDLRGRSTGLLSAEGADWLAMRSALKRRIMRPGDVGRFSPAVDAVAGDLLERVARLRGREGLVLDVNQLMFKYAMEGIALVLYETRLGCLEAEVPPATRDYVGALELMFSKFRSTMYAGAIPPWLRGLFPAPWDDFCRSWDGLFKFSEMLLEQRLRAPSEGSRRGPHAARDADAADAAAAPRGILTQLLLSRELSLQQIHANTTELMLAGIDTTSFTLTWSLYELARHPAVQAAVAREVLRHAPPGRGPPPDLAARMPLLKGVVKEILRLYPVLPGNGRITQQDLVLGGYFVPKGTQLALCHYSASRDEAAFPDSGAFRPERWLRAGPGSSGRLHGFGSIPFGYGVRSCVGRRLAELEMQLAIARVLQRYELRIPQGEGPVYPRTHGLLCPAGPVNLCFVPRH